MSNLHPAATVIIPTYNRAGLIPCAIKSVIDQSMQNWELIVVDDASNDATETAVKSFRGGRIRYVRNDRNMGGGYSRNLGIDLAQGDFVSFLDSDDQWQPLKLEMQLDAARSEGNRNTVCYSRLEADDGKRKTVVPARAKRANERLGDYLFVSDGEIQTSSILMPLELARAVKFRPHLRRHQDWDLCLRLEERGARFLMLDEPLVRWRTDPRTDRITLSGDYQASLEWLQESAGRLSIRAQKAFLAKEVAVSLGRAGEKRKAAQYIGDALLCRALTLHHALKLAAKLSLPAALHERLRQIYRLLK